MNAYDFHLSTNWCGGMQWSPALDIPAPCQINSYTKEQPDQFIDSIESNAILCGHTAFVKNEIVFEKTIHDIKKYLTMVGICNLSQIQTKQPGDRRIWQKFEQDPMKKKAEVEQILKANNMEKVKVILMNIQGDICPDTPDPYRYRLHHRRARSDPTPNPDPNPTPDPNPNTLDTPDTPDEPSGGKKIRKRKSRKVKKARKRKSKKTRKAKN